jgi:hypothetical protein
VPKQICFMVMPFETKPSGAKNGPSEIDFDHLWQEGLRPVIEKLGYRAVRADQDWGPVIAVVTPSWRERETRHEHRLCGR